MPRSRHAFAVTIALPLLGAALLAGCGATASTDAVPGAGTTPSPVQPTSAPTSTPSSAPSLDEHNACAIPSWAMTPSPGASSAPPAGVLGGSCEVPGSSSSHSASASAAPEN